VTPGELVLGGGGAGLEQRGDRVEQDLLDRALDGSQSEALLQQTVGGVLIE
jgi:hypothetical protein